jgi:hypothetical protein
MAQEMVDIRMLRTLDQCPIVLELVIGQTYRLPRVNAEALRDAGVLEFVTEKSARLEAAALSVAARRG